jgi:hypothetical protein
VKPYFVLLLFMLPLLCQAQTEGEKIKSFEAQRQADLRRSMDVQIDSAVWLTDHERYEEADAKFKTILGQLRSIPSDLVYHFGRNSFYIERYKQSLDWLTKYIQLKGTSGQYSEAAVDLLHQAEQKLLMEKQAQSKEAGAVLSKSYYIDCGVSGKVSCPVCKGTTVIVKHGYMGDTYKTCPYCHQLGYLTCDDYNKLMRGELDPSDK